MNKLSIAELKAGVDYSQTLIENAKTSNDELDVKFFTELKGRMELQLEIKLRELYYS